MKIFAYASLWFLNNDWSLFCIYFRNFEQHSLNASKSSCSEIMRRKPKIFFSCKKMIEIFWNSANMKRNKRWKDNLMKRRQHMAALKWEKQNIPQIKNSKGKGSHKKKLKNLHQKERSNSKKNCKNLTRKREKQYTP